MKKKGKLEKIAEQTSWENLILRGRERMRKAHPELYEPVKKKKRLLRKMVSYPKTEEELISGWLDLAKDTWGGYAWAGPATWASLASDGMVEDFSELTHHPGVFCNSWGKKGALGSFPWITPKAFKLKILINPFTSEGRLYLAHAGTEYLDYVNL